MHHRVKLIERTSNQDLVETARKQLPAKVSKSSQESNPKGTNHEV
jgi:hypothetical protein